MSRWLRLFTLWGVFLTALSPIQSDDLFMYLALGRRFMVQGEFGATDPFLFTIKDYPWHLWHEWLSYLTYFNIYQRTGFTGIVVLRALMVTAFAELILRSAQRSRRSPLAGLVILGAALALAAPRSLADRASLFSDLFTCLLVFFFVAPHFRPSWKMGVGLPLLFLLWVQLHPGFPIGLILLGLVFLCHARQWSGSERWMWALTIAACGLATFINPLGWTGAWYPIAKFFAPDWQIFRSINSEWQNTLTCTFLSLPYKVLFTLGTVVTLGLCWRKGQSWFSVGAALILGYLGFSAVRFLALAGFGLGIVAATSWPPSLWSQVRSARQMNIWGALLVVALLAPLWSGPRSILAGRPIHEAIPVKAAEKFLELKPGPIFNEYDFGGLLAWTLDGRMKIAAHGHIDSPELVVEKYFRFSDSRQAWDDIITAGQVEYFFVHRNTIVDHPDAAFVKELTLSNHWQLIHQDELAFIFERHH